MAGRKAAGAPNKAFGQGFERMQFSGKKADHGLDELGGEPTEQTRLKHRIEYDFRQNFFPKKHSYILAKKRLLFKC